jgi:Leucine-rich repeat (LRR) protein
MARTSSSRARLASVDKKIEEALKAGANSLSLSGADLTAVPAAVFNLTTLTRLHLDNNRLTTLPDELIRLRNLRELDIGQN